MFLGPYRLFDIINAGKVKLFQITYNIEAKLNHTLDSTDYPLTDNTPAFFQISVYIPDYSGMSVNVVNAKDVIRDLIKDFLDNDLSTLISEHGEWLSLYSNINHLFELLDSK
jgi:hypothetical protein